MSPTIANDLVTIEVQIDGEPLDQSFEIRGVSVIKEVNRIPTARVVLLDGDPALQDFRASSDNRLKPGGEIEILVGYDSDNRLIFKGIISRHRICATRRGASELSLLCEDIAARLTKGRKSAHHAGKTESEVIELLLKGGGLQAKVDSIPKEFGETVQFNASDWDFIVTRAEANGRVVMVNNGIATVKKANMTGTPKRTLTYGVDLFEFEAEERSTLADNDDVHVESWDPETQTLIDDGEGDEKLNLSHSGSRPKAELAAWKQAAIDRQQLSRIQGRAKIQGVSELTPGDLVELNGMGSRFKGPAFVSAVSHDIAAGDWFTQVQFGLSAVPFHERYPITSPSAGGLLPAVSGLQIGLVSQIIDDPYDQFRVQVKLPLVESGQEGIWARVARLDAGSNRGAVFLPETGDEVVLGFLNDDPRDAIILGMLHSTKNAPPLGAQEGNPQKGFISREQIKVLFNDELKSLELSTPARNSILLSDDEEALTLVDQHDNRFEMTADGVVIEAQGNKIELTNKGIVLKSAADLSLQGIGAVKLEGSNIDISAQGQLKATGNAGIEVSSSGIAVLKGSLVKIN